MRQLQEKILHHQSRHVPSGNFFSMMPRLLGTETSKIQTEAIITKNKQLDNAICFIGIRKGTCVDGKTGLPSLKSNMAFKTADKAVL